MKRIVLGVALGAIVLALLLWGGAELAWRIWGPSLLPL